MFRSISWGQYLTFLFICLVVFYAWLHRRFRIFDPILNRIAKATGKPADQPTLPSGKPADQPTTSPLDKPDQPPINNPPKPPSQTTLFLIAMLAASTTTATAQTADGNAGINQANTLIRSYFTTAVQLMYAISALIGIAGAIHVYVKMLRGHHDTQQAATAWFSACIFIAVVATVIQFFFGL